MAETETWRWPRPLAPRRSQVNSRSGAVSNSNVYCWSFALLCFDYSYALVLPSWCKKYVIYFLFYRSPLYFIGEKLWIFFKETGLLRYFNF